jgi:two-component system chemotaxis response regulator CheB
LNAASGSPLRALVVEDSFTIRRHLVGVLERNGIIVAGEAGDGQRAIELCRELRPDVVTMDMILPGTSGLVATEQIMAYTPTPILVVSASANRGEVFQTYDALAAGAVDVFDKVRAGEAPEDWAQRFVAAVRMAARIKVITHPRARLQQPATALSPAAPVSASGLRTQIQSLAARPATESKPPVDIIALGASTGGPAALVEILHALPADFPVPILAVLHLSELFAFAFAEWLNTMSPLPARYVRDGEPFPRTGTPQILLAPAGRHLVVDRSVLRLSDAPERHSCRPSVDVLFESLARKPGLSAMLCLLTGMGRDGAAGLLAARQSGLRTIAQDEASSVIFGMPGEAVRLGAAERVLPLNQISGALLAAAGAGLYTSKTGHGVRERMAP